MLRPHVGARTDSTSALAHWKLDEASATDNAADALSAYTLTQSGSPQVRPSLFAVPPGSTGARAFDGVNDYFQGLGNTVALEAFRDSDFAVSAVVKPDTVSGNRSIVAYNGPTSAADDNSQILLNLSGSEIRVFWEYSTSTNVSNLTTGAGLQANKTYLIVVAVEDDSTTTRRIRVYAFEKDVGLVHEETFTGQTKSDDGDLAQWTIGQNGRGSEYFDGTIDDIAVWKYPLSRDAAFLLYGETFGISYDEETIYDSDAGAYHLRVRIEDANGTLRDLTDLAHSQDLVVSADVSDDIDQPGASATVSVVREVDSWSLAHDVQASPLNQLTGSYAALVDLNSRILIDTAVIPQGMTPNDWDWVPLFDGYISAIDWGADQISITAGDKIGPLANTFIAREPLDITSIDDNGAGNTVIVETSVDHGLSVGDKIKINATTNYNGRWTVAEIISVVQFRTGEPTTGGPYAAESAGKVFKDDQRSYGDPSGTPVQTVIQEIIDDNEPKPYTGGTPYGYIGGTPSVYTPVDPSFDIRPFWQKREPVSSALEVLASMIGWNIKFRWHAGARAFRLTLFEPERAKSSPDYTFTTAEVLEVSRASIEGGDIRNAVEVIYSDFDNADENNFAPRVTVLRSDAASIAKYGYRFCQIAEASTSQIDSYTEAADLADAILSDLAEPKADISIEVPLRRFVDTGDLYRLPADGYHWDSSKDVAVIGYSHSFGDGGARTTLTLRGQPASRNKGWVLRFVEPGLAPNQPTTPPVETTTAPTLSPVPGGAEVFQNIPNDLRARNFDTTEIHVSQTSGFTPSASTYKQIARANRAQILNLDPAQTHYVRTQFRDKFGNVSRWSDQGTVTPRYMLSVPAARAYRATSAQAIPASTWTTVQLNAEDYDKRNNFNTSTYKFAAPVDGVYSILCHVAVDFGSKSGQVGEVRLMKNGATLVATGTSVVGEDHTNIAHPTLNASINLSASDEVFVQVWADTSADIEFAASAAAARTFFSIVLVSQD
jgi:hypothetical protein